MINERNLYEIAEIIRTRCGIDFNEKKFKFLKRRIVQRMEILEFEDFRQYKMLLKNSLNNADSEFTGLINSLTIRETYFFRNKHHFEYLKNHIIPDLVKQKIQHGENNIKILSAGCSTGEEPYSISIILSSLIENIKNWKIRIDAVDINTDNIHIAEKGIYLNDSKSLKLVDEKILNTYFTRKSDENYRINYECRKMVSFHHCNLLDENARELKNDTYDLIFIRNVLIYFSSEYKKQILDKLYNKLKDNGIILVGYSETLRNYSDKFSRKFEDNSTIYNKKCNVDSEIDTNKDIPERQINIKYKPASYKSSEQFKPPSYISRKFKTNLKNGVCIVYLEGNIDSSEKKDMFNKLIITLKYIEMMKFKKILIDTSKLDYICNNSMINIINFKKTIKKNNGVLKISCIGKISDYLQRKKLDNLFENENSAFISFNQGDTPLEMI